MIVRRAIGLNWFALVFTSSASVAAQVTVADEPAPAAAPAATPGPASSIRAAARDRRSISIGADTTDATATPSEVPEFHTVERGDTLWDITGAFFTNPWRWPAVWGLNPQITNPHWIFPGDQVRLLPAGTATATANPNRTQNLTNGPLNLPASRVAPQTVFLPQQGWIDSSQAQSSGTIVGSPDDQMLLAEGDQAYVAFPNHTPHVGEQFTIYQDGQGAHSTTSHHAGHVVRVLGSATVESFDRDRHVATVRITESLDGIERGERVATMPRRLQVVPPQRNSVDLRATITATVHPRELVGQNMVVFMDRGSDDHVAPGNRLFVVRRGDAWARTLVTGSRYASGTGLDRDGDGNIDGPPGAVRPNSQLPEEIVGEVQVLDVQPHSATGLLTSSVVEVEVGDVLEMRRNY